MLALGLIKKHPEKCRQAECGEDMKKDRKRCMSVHNQLSQSIKMHPYDSAAPNSGRADTFNVIFVGVW